MKKLVLATASVLALGIAGMGVGSAQTPSSSPNAQTPSPSAQTPYASPNAQSPSSSAQMPSSATMSQGAQGQSAPVNLSQTEIQQLQQQLKGAGLYRGSVDGEMGPETKQAISKFQQQHGLNQTGVVDQHTLSALSTNQGGAGSRMGTSGAQPSGASSAGNPNPSTAPNTTR
jgi:peptidoglycan hydrolase-like protein with peptidoglycan-binding domain